MTLADVKKSITFKTESPYVEVSTVDKYMAVYDSIKAWVLAYVDV